MKKLLVILLLICLALWFAGFLAFSYHINNYKQDEGSKTDAIIALTGGKNRIAEAVNLLNKGLADKMFISGVQKDISLKEIKQRKDVKIETKREIELGNQSTNTVENAIETNEWINKNKIKSIRLVTSNYHLPRSIEEFRSRNPKLIIIAHPVYSERVSKKWWKNEGSFCLIASEYSKFLYVYIRTALNQFKGKMK